MEYRRIPLRGPIGECSDMYISPLLGVAGKLPLARGQEHSEKEKEKLEIKP